MHIRSATISDAGALSCLIRTGYQTVARRFNLTLENCPKHPSNCTKAWVLSDFERDVRYYILESEAENVGCSALEKADSERCYLERLAVLPQKRHQGFGKMLVTHVVEEAKSIGCQSVGIGIISKEHQLKKWYGKIGFKEGITRSFEHLPFDVTFMEYRLM